MIPFKAFHTLIQIISGARERITREHMEFLEFYLQLVQVVPNDIATDFGRISSPVMIGKTKHDYQIELTMTDFLWWKSAIMDEGARMVKTVGQIQRDIWDKLIQQIDSMALNEEEKGALMSALFNNGESYPSLEERPTLGLVQNT